MTSFIFTILSISIFIHKHECAMLRHLDLDHHKRVLRGGGMEYILHKYLSPLRKLTAELPNHAIEMQIEMIEPSSTSSPGPTSSVPVPVPVPIPVPLSPSIPAPPVPAPQRRVIRVMNRHPKKIAKSGGNDVSLPSFPVELPMHIPNQGIEMQIEFVDPASMASPPVGPVPQRRVIRVMNRHPKKLARSDVTPQSGALKQGPETPEETTTEPPPDPPPSSAPDVPPAAASDDPSNKPVYWEDLQKAINDLEKKIESKQGAGTGPATPCNEEQKKDNAPQSSPLKVQSIDDILEILKKAVHIEKHVPKPNDDDHLNWVQIKIPKN